MRCADRRAVVPPQAGDVHELRVILEQTCQRVGVSPVPRLGEERRYLLRSRRSGRITDSRCRWGLRPRRKPLPRPSAIEADELCAVSIQDVGCTYTLISFIGKDHDDESSCTNVVDMVAQMLVLLGRTREAKQRALELSQESVLLPCGIEAADIFVTVQDVDVLSIEASTK